MAQWLPHLGMLEGDGAASSALPGWVLRGKTASGTNAAPTGAKLGSLGPEPPTLHPRAGGCCVPRAGGLVMGSGGGQQVAAMQVEISLSPLERWALLGELRVPPASVVLPGCLWLCHQPVAPGPSAEHMLWCLCSPPFLPTMLPRPEETSVAGKARQAPAGAACSALHGCALHVCGSRVALGSACGRQARVAVARQCWCPVLSASEDRHGGFTVPCPALRARPCQHPALPCGLGGSKLLAPGAEGCWDGSGAGLAAVLAAACSAPGMAQVGRRSRSFKQGKEQAAGSLGGGSCQCSGRG